MHRGEGAGKVMDRRRMADMDHCALAVEFDLGEAVLWMLDDWSNANGLSV